MFDSYGCAVPFWRVALQSLLPVRLGFWGAALSVGGSVLGRMFGSSKKKKAAKESKKMQEMAMDLADPFRRHRQYYGARLNGLMQDPNSVTQTPGYQFRFNQGMESVQRSAAAAGLRGSGNVLVELMKQGQGMASQEYQAEWTRLAELAGALRGSPTAAGQVAENASVSNYNTAANQADQTQYTMGALGQAAGGLYDWWKGYGR